MISGAAIIFGMFFTLSALCCCKAGKDADEEMDRQHREWKEREATGKALTLSVN